MNPDRRNIDSAQPFFFRYEQERKDEDMGKGILLWLLGVPIPLILIGWLIFH